MASSYSICIIPGDGIGPEVTACARRVLDALGSRTGRIGFSYGVHPGGHDAWRDHGTALPDATMAAAKAADAILVGAMDVANIPVGVTEPLGWMRKQLGVNASVRPARTVAGLSRTGAAIDTVVVREVTEGLYSGIEYMAGEDAACAVRLITREASTKAARVAFEQASARRGRVTAVHKIGVLKVSDGLFLEAARAVAADYPGVEFETRNVDACAMDLILHPERFDVILASNAFGDIISDVAVALAGGLGLAPSSCIGDRWGYFEPVHGTAPDIAGKGVANPCATILTAAMMLRHLGETEAGDAVEGAVMDVLAAGAPRTGDLGGSATSEEMTAAIVAALEARLDDLE